MRTDHPAPAPSEPVDTAGAVLITCRQVSGRNRFGHALFLLDLSIVRHDRARRERTAVAVPDDLLAAVYPGAEVVVSLDGSDEVVEIHLDGAEVPILVGDPAAPPDQPRSASTRLEPR